MHSIGNLVLFFIDKEPSPTKKKKKKGPGNTSLSCYSVLLISVSAPLRPFVSLETYIYYAVQHSALPLCQSSAFIAVVPVLCGKSLEQELQLLLCWFKPVAIVKTLSLHIP